MECHNLLCVLRKIFLLHVKNGLEETINVCAMINGGIIAILPRRNGVAGTCMMAVVVGAVGRFMLVDFEVIIDKVLISCEREGQK